MSTPHPQFLPACRELLGVRWRHLGRQPWALDCIGLIVLALRACGREVADRNDYGRDPQRDGLAQALRAEFGQPVAEWIHGGIALIRWPGAELPAHVGVLARDGEQWRLIHSYSSPGCVVEHRVDEHWRGLIVEVFDPWRS